MAEAHGSPAHGLSVFSEKQTPRGVLPGLWGWLASGFLHLSPLEPYLKGIVHSGKNCG